MNIRFLYIRDCPYAGQALNLLKEVLKERNIDDEIEIVEIKSEDDVEKYHFLGSPSIQINGTDIEKERMKDSPVFGCRIYKSDTGFSGMPPKRMIVEAIESAY